LQIFGNFLLVWQCSSFCRDVCGDALPGGDWKSCLDCTIYVPPRAHHCPLCQHCIADRDHHCFFTASSVGRDNRRHFIALCVDCAVGTADATHVAFQYVRAFHGDGGYLYSLFPIAVVRWIIGWQTGSCVLYVGFTYMCALSFLGAAAVAVWQFFLVARGQTLYEFVKGSFRSSSSSAPKAIMKNIHCVFGPYWPVVILCPWPVFSLYSDSSYTKSV